jgi:hypothetical protein
VQSRQHVDETRRVEGVDCALPITSTEPKELMVRQVKAIHRDVRRGGAQLVGYAARQRRFASSRHARNTEDPPTAGLGKRASALDANFR